MVVKMAVAPTNFSSCAPLTTSLSLSAPPPLLSLPPPPTLPSLSPLFQKSTTTKLDTRVTLGKECPTEPFFLKRENPPSPPKKTLTRALPCGYSEIRVHKKEEEKKKEEKEEKRRSQRTKFCHPPDCPSLVLFLFCCASHFSLFPFITVYHDSTY